DTNNLNHGPVGVPPSNFMGATYHFGEEISAQALPTKTEDHHEYGYAAGIYQQTVPPDNDESEYPVSPVGMLTNASQDEVHIWFKDKNQLSASLALDNVD